MTAGAQRLAALLPSAPADGDITQIGRVTAIAGSTATAPVTVRVLGANLQLPRLASYPTPAVGDDVLLIRAGGTWVVFGRLTGFPT